MHPLIGRDQFAKLVRETNHHILQACQDAVAKQQREDPQWRRHGLKLLELLEPLKQTLNDGNTRRDMEELSRGSAGRRAKGVCDEDWALKHVRGGKGVESGRVENKRGGRAKRKWLDDVAQRRLEGPIKMGQYVLRLDEDDEEELPVGRTKCEEGVKVERDDDGMVKRENEEE